MAFEAGSELAGDLTWQLCLSVIQHDQKHSYAVYGRRSYDLAPQAWRGFRREFGL